MGLADNSFPTAVFGYVCPIGSLHDPLGKEGLANVYVDIFSYGKRKGSPVLEILNKLESLGAQFQAEAGSEVTYLYIRCPKENVGSCRKLLDRLITDIEITEEDFKKIISSLLKKLQEVESDDREYAKIRFYRGVIGERISIGTKNSLRAIKINDIWERISQVHSQMKPFHLNGPNDYHFDPDLAGILRKSVPIYRRRKRLQFIDKEYEQKSLFLGFETSGALDFSFAVTQVATSALHGGLTGVVVEEIREKRSAAYYAGYRHKIASKRGCSFMYAGVSEKNIVECVEVMVNIFHNLSKSLLPQKNIEIARNYSIGKLSRMFDSIESITFIYLLFYMQGRELLPFEALKSEFCSVTLEQVQQYFKKFVKGKGSLVVNGNLTGITKDNLKKILA